MKPKFELPSELVQGTSINGNEYGWPPALFPDAALRAESLGYACLGGQFQFRASVGTCEMYWLSADSTDRQPTEEWSAFCTRSRAEVLERFHQIVAETDFQREAVRWPVLRSEMERGIDLLETLVFVAYFVTETEWLADDGTGKQKPAVTETSELPVTRPLMPDCVNSR